MLNKKIQASGRYKKRRLINWFVTQRNLMKELHLIIKGIVISSHHENTSLIFTSLLKNKQNTKNVYTNITNTTIKISNACICPKSSLASPQSILLFLLVPSPFICSLQLSIRFVFSRILNKSTILYVSYVDLQFNLIFLK